MGKLWIHNWADHWAVILFFFFLKQSYSEQSYKVEIYQNKLRIISCKRPRFIFVWKGMETWNKRWTWPFINKLNTSLSPRKKKKGIIGPVCEVLLSSKQSDWDGVNFLQSSLHGAAFYVCDYNSADNTPVFQLLLACFSLCPCSK